VAVRADGVVLGDGGGEQRNEALKTALHIMGDAARQDHPTPAARGVSQHIIRFSSGTRTPQVYQKASHSRTRQVHEPELRGWVRPE
jgi:hypothetical protein